jgi:NDP-sugar pyrophosphorylase family protein
LIPKNVPYNATDLMECLLRENGKLISFAHHDYWLDIGRPEDYEKANDDVKQFKFHCS